MPVWRVTAPRALGLPAWMDAWPLKAMVLMDPGWRDGGRGETDMAGCVEGATGQIAWRRSQSGAAPGPGRDRGPGGLADPERIRATGTGGFDVLCRASMRETELQPLGWVMLGVRGGPCTLSQGEHWPYSV